MELKHSWVDDAACAGHPLSEKYAWDYDHPKHHDEAIAVCNTVCPVREQCLNYAVENFGTEGILGGSLFKVRPKRDSDESSESESIEV